LTFIEVLISVVLLTLITGAISAAFVTAMNSSRPTNARVRESNDAQLIAAFLVRDAQAAGGVDPTNPLSTGDPTLGVSLTDASGCTGSGSLVFRFAWRDWMRPGVSRLHVANYFYTAATNQLVRQTCVDGVASTSTTLGYHIASTSPSCDPANLCPGMPDSVSLTITETNNPLTSSPTPYTYTLRATVRPQGQVPPSGGTPLGFPALLALGGGSTCPTVSSQGGASVFIGGDAVVNSADVGSCTTMLLTDKNYSQAYGTTDLLTGGTCSGGGCPASAGTIGSQLPDPFATLPPPGDCSGPQTGSLSGNQYSPGVYKSAVTVAPGQSVTFLPGNYIFCQGVTLKGTVTANGVLFYVAQGAMTITAQAAISMSASPTGLYAGILIWIPKTNPSTALGLVGGAVVNTYSGLIYVPNVDVTFSGTSGSAVGSIIARTITFSGGGNDIIGIPPVSITGPATLSNWTIGRDYPNTPMTASGGTTPYTWSAPALLAMGLTINAGTGVISGTPSATGTFPVTITVTDSFGLTATQTYSVTINPAPAITGPATLADWTMNRAYPNQTMTESGGTTPFTWAASGLPTGMSINPATGVISGTPTVTGATTVTVTVTDTAGASASRTYTMTINAAPTVTTPALPEWTINRPGYNAAVAAGSGTPPYTWNATGLPKGLTIDTNTGAITGTPNPKNPGAFTVTVTITDSTGATATRTYTLTINGAPSVSGPASLPAWTVGRDYPGTQVIAQNGTTPYTWAAAGLPGGMTINPNTGVISGTPGTSGTFAVVVTLTDAAGATAPGNFSLVISKLPSITTTSLPNGEQGLVYSATVSATNGTTPYAWAASGMPAGLTINAGTGVISGTPTATGTFSVTVTVTDSAGASATSILTLTISTGPSIATASLPGWDANAPGYSATLAVIGGSGGYTWTKTAGTLPAGLTLNAATGVISGTPTTAGTSSGLVFKVTDSSGGTSTSGSLSIVISPQLTVTTTSPLPTATQGQTGYSKTLAQTGGLGPFVWSLQSGSLPTGLNLSAAGVISGNVGASATTQTFTVAITDASGVTVTKSFTITVNASPTVNTSALPAGGIGAAYSQTLAVAGGTAPFTWSITVGTLPTGLNLSAAGVISGTIGTGATTQTFSVVVTDANGVASPGKSLTIVVNPAPTVTSLTPNTAATGSTLSVVIAGTGFATGAQVAFNAGTGSAGSFTITLVTVNSATQITVNVKIANGAAARGTYNVVVTNLDGGVSTSSGTNNVFTVN
jgi:hypothetical protein